MQLKLDNVRMIELKAYPMSERLAIADWLAALSIEEEDHCKWTRQHLVMKTMIKSHRLMIAI